MSEEAKNYIAAVIHTMDKITVSGEDNLDMMLGCIRTLRKVLAEEENNGKSDS